MPLVQPLWMQSAVQWCKKYCITLSVHSVRVVGGSSKAGEVGLESGRAVQVQEVAGKDRAGLCCILTPTLDLSR